MKFKDIRTEYAGDTYKIVIRLHKYSRGPLLEIEMFDTELSIYYAERLLEDLKLAVIVARMITP